jgi:hypothetical protein
MSPSQAIAEALEAKGYRAIAQHCVRRKLGGVEFVYYVCGRPDSPMHALLMMTEHDQAWRETHCELYQPLVRTNSVDELIAAIP